MAEAFTLADMRDATPVFLLDLTWGGRTFHMSTEPIVLSSDDGARPYEGGLDMPTYRETLDRLQDAIPGQSASIDVHLPIDVTLHRRRGHDPAGATGELSMVSVKAVPGRLPTSVQTYEKRIRLFKGNVTGAAYDDPEKASAGWLGFTLEEPEWEDSGRIIPNDARVNETTWPLHLSDHDGKVYPTVIGQPGRFLSSSGTVSRTHGSPAYVIDTTAGAVKLLIAGHQVVAATVKVLDSTNFDTFTVTNEADGLGRIVATITITAGDAIDPTETEFWASWTDGAAMLSPYAAGVGLTNGGDVARWVMSRSTIPQDHGRWAVAGQYINRLEVSTYINDPAATPWDWLADHLLPLIPISIARSSDGTYPVVYDLDLNRQDMVQITEGADFRRVGPFTQEGSPSDVRNDFAIEYASRAKFSGQYKRRAMLTPEPDSDDSEQFANNYAKLSFARYKVLQTWAKSTGILYLEESATQVLFWMSRLLGFIPETATYTADHHWAWLRAGRAVSITEAGANQTTQAGWVVDRYWNNTHWVYVLLFDDDVPRDVRATN